MFNWFNEWVKNCAEKKVFFEAWDERFKDCKLDSAYHKEIAFNLYKLEETVNELQKKLSDKDEA